MAFALGRIQTGEQIVKWVTSCQSTLNQKEGSLTDWETHSWNSPSRLYIIVNDAIGISPSSQMQNICHVILFIGLRSHKSPLAQY